MKRFVAILTVWAMGLAWVVASVVFPASSASAAVTTPGGYTSLSPYRLLDTRDGTGAPAGAVAPSGVVSLQVTGRGGVPGSGVSAVVLNVTVTEPTASGYVSVYGDATTRPLVSNLNYVKGQVVPNLVVAPVGTNGKVALFNGSPGTTQLVADVSGYFLSGEPTASGAFSSLTPARLLDTRSGVGAPMGAVAPGGTVSLNVRGPDGAPPMGPGPSAVVLNVTVAEPTASGYITVYGNGTTRPTASNLNYVAGQVVPNLVVAPVGDDGNVELYNGSPGTVHLIADISGYFGHGAPAAAGTLGSLTPYRLLDTRDGTGASQAAVAPGGTVSLQVAGRGGVPASGASAVVLNVTVAEPTGSGYVTVYGDGTTRPLASNLNYVRNQVVPNLVVAPVGSNGKVALYNGSPGTVQLIADVSGWFSNAPAANVGAISGAVTDAGGTHHGLGGVQVFVGSSSTGASGGATTAANGTYMVSDLPAAADYTVCFQAGAGATGGSNDTLGYIDQCYNNQPFFGTPTPVTITAGVTTPAINAALADAGGVSGTVTDAGGTHHGLAGVYVNADSPSSSGGAVTAADGSYTIKGLAAGTDYQVCFQASGATGGSSDTPGYVDQCYNNQPTSGMPTPVTVTAGATTPAINAALVAGGMIAGTVTDAGGTHHGLANVWVNVWSPSTGAGGGTSTADDGTYSMVVPAGTDYTVCFGASGATGGSSDTTGYVDQCYNNQPPSGTPTPVSVTAGATTHNINAALLAGGAIAGTVTDAAGTHHGLANVNVNVFSPSTGDSWAGQTAADGTYSVTVPPGTGYQVCFYANGATGGSTDALGYVDQCYNNQPISGTPTPVSVTTGNTTNSINAALSTAGAIHGTVTDAGGTHHGLENVNVNVWSPSTGYSSGSMTAADGSYTVSGLPTGGDYQVCFWANGATGGSSDTPGYIDQCYNNQPTSGTPTPVGVTAGSTTNSINAALVAGGAVAGTVTDAGGAHHGLANVNVNVFSPSTGDSWGSQTAADGSYSVTVPAGTGYQVCFYANGATGGSSDTLGYVDQCYNNQPLSGTPTPVSVTAGATTESINAALAGGGAIHGTVTDAGGSHHGLANVNVNVSSPSTGFFSGATTAADGSYTVTGIPTGSDYQVCFYANDATGGSHDTPGYIDQCYNNQPTSGTPTPVSVTAGTTTNAINAALAAGGAIAGTVTDAGGTHHGLENVWVNVWSPSASDGSGTMTGPDGSYSVNVPPGTDYQVCFHAPGATGGSHDTPGYVDQCYNNQPPSGTPAPVSVTAGATTNNINAALAAGGAIAGTVSHSGGPVANLNVFAFSPSTGNNWGTQTDSDGNYSLIVPPGTGYQVCFYNPGYVDQCYNNQPPSTPTPVTVTLGATTSGIDATLVAGMSSLNGVPGTAGTPHWLLVPKRSATGSLSRPHAMFAPHATTRPPLMSSPYLRGSKAIAHWRQQVLAQRSSSGLARARIGAR
jgi:hypothetical protein